jgi:hypothetical protein
MELNITKYHKITARREEFQNNNKIRYSTVGSLNNFFECTPQNLFRYFQIRIDMIQLGVFKHELDRFQGSAIGQEPAGHGPSARMAATSFYLFVPIQL